MEIEIEVTVKKKTPLEFLSRLKAWLEAELQDEFIGEFAIFQEVGQETQYQFLDQAPKKESQVEDVEGSEK